MQDFKVYVRWRPLIAVESATAEIERICDGQGSSARSVSFEAPSSSSAQNRPWKSGKAFTEVFEPTDDNRRVFDAVVAPTLPKVLLGQTCNFFAYGHSGSGKSHTIIGYNYENPDELGMFLAAARRVCMALEGLNTGESDKYGIGIRMFEMRKNTAYDLLNGKTECHVREGPDGKTHIRGETEMLEEGKVRVRPIVSRACWSVEDVHRELQAGLKLRATGTSSIHDQSSRTHAVLELEIVNEALIAARDAVIERQSELVPVGKRATDIYLEEQMKSLIKTDDGYVRNPDCPPNQARIDEAEAEKAQFERRVEEAEALVASTLASRRHSSLGGKFVFVDLAGSEYCHEKPIPTSLLKK